MKATATIEVTACAACGSHATESDYDSTPEPLNANQIGQVGMFVPFMAVCSECGLLACFSCLSDGACCDRRAEIEMEGLPKAGQMALFGEETS